MVPGPASVAAAPQMRNSRPKLVFFHSLPTAPLSLLRRLLYLSLCGTPRAVFRRRRRCLQRPVRPRRCGFNEAGQQERRQSAEKAQSAGSAHGAPPSLQTLPPAHGATARAFGVPAHVERPEELNRLLLHETRRVPQRPAPRGEPRHALTPAARGASWGGGTHRPRAGGGSARRAE